MQTARKRRNRGHTLQCRSSTEGSGRTKQKKDKRQRVPPYAPHPPCPIPPCQGARARGRCRQSQSRGRAKECSVLGW